MESQSQKKLKQQENIETAKVVDVDYEYNANNNSNLDVKHFWFQFKEYKRASIAKKSYNPTVYKHIIPKKDFTDINISNFIVFYVNKYSNDDKKEIKELAQYLLHCFVHHGYCGKLSITLKQFPKTEKTWYTIHQKGKNIRIVNIPTTGSNAKGIDLIKQKIVPIEPVVPGGINYAVGYAVVDWNKSSHAQISKLEQTTFDGYFDCKEISNFEIVMKLRKYMDLKQLNVDGIVDCFKQYQITHEYFKDNTRKDFVQLLKEKCNVKVSLAMKLWNHFSPDR